MTIRRPAIPVMRVPMQPADWSSTYPGAAGSSRCGLVQPRGTSTSVVPFSGAESERKLKVSSLPVVPAVSLLGTTLIFPTPEPPAAPVAEASTSRERQAPSANPVIRLSLAAAIDPARVY